MKNKIIYSLALIAVVIAVGAMSTYATEGRFTKYSKNIDPDKKVEMQVKNEAVKTAIENNDYQAWQELMSERPGMADKITEEDFVNMVKIHQLMKDGNYEEVKQFKEELGYNMNKRGMMGKNHKMRFEDKNGDGFCDHLDKE